MVTKEQLREVINEDLPKRNTIGRQKSIPLASNRIIVVTGVRRCGKSTLLKQSFKNEAHKISINFEDTRIEGFELKDFNKVSKIAEEEGIEVFLFDEIQNIDGWEKFVRSAHEQGKKIYITGSNASMLSKELGTKLTGRHKSIELFPFSFKEYLEFTRQTASCGSFQKYLDEGGFPEFLEEKDGDYLRTLLSDIVLRDIVVRRKIRNEKVILKLAVHTISNVGKEFSFNNITKLLEIKSVRTTIDYCDYLQESYLVEYITKYDKSTKKQQVNPKKAYAVDTGLAKANSLSFSADKGRMLENSIFLGLRRKFNDIMYFKTEKVECDFIVRQQEMVVMAVQVCWHLHEDNLEREVNGIREALQNTGAEKGMIITFDQEDEMYGIPVIPAWKWLLTT